MVQVYVRPLERTGELVEQTSTNYLLRVKGQLEWFPKVLCEVQPHPDAWNPAHFGETPRQVDPDGQLSIFWDNSAEPPDPDDYPSLEAYEQAWQAWEEKLGDTAIAQTPSYVTENSVTLTDNEVQPLHKNLLNGNSYVTENPVTLTDNEFQPLHKIQSEIRQLSGSQQIELRDWLNELLSEDDSDWLPRAVARREVVKTERSGSSVYQLEKVRCGKNCQKCPHGPYWYSYTRVNGKIKSKYVGKSR